jgi:ATP-dependent Lon protease
MRKKYMEYVNKVLEDTIYGHNSTKKQIKSIISQWLAGGFKTGVVIGIQGPPGVGKTTVIKGAISKCLIDFIDYNLDEDKIFVRLLDLETDKVEPRPFCFTSLGGTTNGSTLLGHNITYHGATSGDIVKHLKEAKIMNPIMYFDELDKISNTEHGHEIYSVLTHITDPVQNSHFTDRYFSEVKIDLSKAIIVFSYNDSKKIERILLDRIQEIRLNPLKPKEKLTICHKFIIPEICSQMGYNTDDITISDNELDMIINEYTIEAGVRKLKEKLFEIFRIRHLELIENPNLKLTNKIDGKFITDTFSDYNKITIKKIKNNNIIGFINGMYASTTGLGGITPIQVKQIYSKELFGISITGSVEKVMEESVKVAKTVGWNLLNKEEQENIIETWNSRGLHIHFPDGSTPKDGPSGGTAITCAIYSLLTNKPIKNNVAITGEIDLDGNVTEIGGLDAKLNGSKKAGIKLALIPKENHREFQIVKKNNPELIGKNFKVIEISHVKQALKYIF